jgi:hypothetical protein
MDPFGRIRSLFDHKLKPKYNLKSYEKYVEIFIELAGMTNEEF